MLVLQGFIYLGSTASLLALCTYIFLAFRGGSPALLSTGYGYRLHWKQKIFLGLAAIGLLVCLASGAQTMLSWIPHSVGRYIEGEYEPLRDTLSFLIAGVFGVMLIMILDEVTHIRVALENTKFQLDQERKIYACRSTKKLEKLQGKFELEIQEIQIKKLHDQFNEGPITLEHEKFYTLNSLLQKIEERKSQMQSSGIQKHSSE